MRKRRTAAEHETEFGAVVISQTCDIVLPDRPNVIVAKLIKLPPEKSRQAQKGLTPRYVHVPNHEKDYFADLEYIATLEKQELAALLRKPGIDPSNDREVRNFSLRVARRFGRFAFPDEVVPWFRPLQKLAEEKSRKPNSPLGKMFGEIVELRVEAGKWLSKNRDLILHVIVKEGTVPEIEPDENGDFPDPPDGLDSQLRPSGTLVKSVSDIAKMIYESPRSEIELYYLWSALGEALGEHCQLKGADADNPDYRSAVKRVTGILSTDQEFSLAQYRRSEMLDLDHLSTPTPLAE